MSYIHLFIPSLLFNKTDAAGWHRNYHNARAVRRANFEICLQAMKVFNYRTAHGPFKEFRCVYNAVEWLGFPLVLPPLQTSERSDSQADLTLIECLQHFHLTKTINMAIACKAVTITNKVLLFRFRFCDHLRGLTSHLISSIFPKQEAFSCSFHLRFFFRFLLSNKTV